MVKQARKVGVGGHVEGMVGAMVDNSLRRSREIVGYRGLCQPGRRQERGIMETERDIAIVKTGSVYVVVGNIVLPHSKPRGFRYRSEGNGYRNG